MKEHEASRNPIMQGLDGNQENIPTGTPQRRPYCAPQIFQHQIDHIVRQGGSFAPDGLSGTKSKR